MCLKDTGVALNSSRTDLLVYLFAKDCGRRIYGQQSAELDLELELVLDLCSLDEQESLPFWLLFGAGCFEGTA